MKYYLSLLFAIIFFIGCEQKPSQTAKSVDVHNQSNPPKKIEVVADQNAKEIKVVQKKVDSTQDKAYYYDYNTEQKSNKQGADEEKTYTKIDAYSRVRSPYEAVELRLMANKLSKNFILRCSPCHDDYANGVIGPSLLDKDGDFIYKRIVDYKTGAKNNPLMQDLTKLLSKEELKSIADEIALFNNKIKQLRKGQE